MATITEDYVSFETAKLLKEKGFPQEYDIYHSMVYNEEDYEDEYEVQRMVVETKLVKAGTLSSYPIGVPEPKCYSPTLQMALKWIKEKYCLHFVIQPMMSMPSCELKWAADTYDTSIFYKELSEFKCVAGTELCDSPEEAVEAALKYCLENLI